MALDSISRMDVVETVYEQLKSNIMNETWKSGEKIPSENELSKIFNVSRVTVRAALHKLRALGLIFTRQGQGTFVSDSINRSMIDLCIPILKLSEKQYEEIMEFRDMVESKSIELAVVRADVNDIQAIGNALQAMIDNTGDYIKFTKADYDFHMAIIKASKNEILYTLMENMKSIFYYHLEELNRVFSPQNAIQIHTDLYNNLKNRDIKKLKRTIKQILNVNLKQVRSFRK